MIRCCDLFVAWFCSYDFDMGHNCDLMWVKHVIFVLFFCLFRFVKMSPNNIRITTSPQDLIRPYQNHVKTLSGMVWYDMVWYGMAWHGMVWYGMVWYGMYVCMHACMHA